MLQFQRSQSSPVIVKGSSYGGWQADAIAAPSCCWDGTRFALTVSLWSVSQSKWATAFFTSSDLVSWSYVTGSLWTPAGSNYLLGNAGLAWFGGKYQFLVETYPSGQYNQHLAIYTSTDLVTWTLVSISILTQTSPDAGGQYDPSLVVNPSGNLEVWYIGNANSPVQPNALSIMMGDSPDGITWTQRGVFLTPDNWNSQGFGEPNVFYKDGVRYMTFDATSILGQRLTGFAASPTLDTTWKIFGTCLGWSPFSSWEQINVFDTNPIGIFDTGDGNGSCIRMLYAGSNIAASTDNTESSLGLSFLKGSIL